MLDFQEAFVCLPFSGKSDRVLVLFFSRFNYKCHPIIDDWIRLARIEVLASFREMLKQR